MKREYEIISSTEPSEVGEKILIDWPEQKGRPKITYGQFIHATTCRKCARLWLRNYWRWLTIG